MNRVKKESNVTYLDDVSTNLLDESVPVNIVNVNVTNIGVPINQHTNCVNKDKDELLEDCGNSSKSSKDYWESASTILRLVTNPPEFELNKKPSGIRDNQVFTLDRSKVSVDSVKADENGNYISEGNPRKYYHWDLENAPRLAHPNKVTTAGPLKKEVLTVAGMLTP